MTALINLNGYEDFTLEKLKKKYILLAPDLTIFFQ